MAARLHARNGMLVWTEVDPTSAESHQIVAGRGDRRQVLVPGLPAVRALVTTANQVIWTDAEGIHILASGNQTDLPAPDARCLAADDDTAYVSHEGLHSVIARVGGAPIAKAHGNIDRLFVVGGDLVWTCAGSHDLFAQPIAGGAPSIVYGAAEPMALCPDDGHHVLIAVGQGLVRVSIASGEIVRLASELTAGTPHAIASHGGIAYITRYDARIGRSIERVIAGQPAQIIHVPLEAVHALAATDAGVHFIEGTALRHLPADAPAITAARGKAPTRPPNGIAVELAADGSLKATFVAAVPSCTELVRQIASEGPRRIDLVCDKASPGEAFSTACNGKQLASVEAIVCDVPWRDTCDGDVGALADVCAAMPSLERAFVRGNVELELIEHARLRELHLVSDVMKPTVAKALGASQLPRLERCALKFPKISTASLLALVKALAQLRAPQLREIHLGSLRGPDQIRDVLSELARRGRPESWTTLAFTGALGSDEALAEVLDGITPPAGIQIALPLEATYPHEVVESLRRRKKWLCDLHETGSFLPCDPRAYAAW